MALGATAGNVITLVLGSASRLVLTGAAIGLALAIVFARTISTFLFGVPPLDPLTFAAVAVLLGVTASIAVAVPALRALRIDPVEAFRTE
jgi:ABC-type antimicrobial peptide transport system permease subunit